MSVLKRYFELLRIILTPSGYKRAEYLRKKNYFKKQGEHVYLIPWKYGTEPHLISFGDNVHVASEVMFVTHDITNAVFNYKESINKYSIRQGEIKVGNNVFIGARSTVLYDVSIGNNVIIGAGSLVNKDIPDNSVAVGVPCRVVGSFDEYKEKLIKRDL